MTTAQVLYEQYKVLPPRIRQELKKMIVKETHSIDEDENEETIRIAVEPLKEGLRELKLVLAGKTKAQSAREMLEEINKELG